MIVFDTIHAHFCILLVVFDMRVQLDRLARQEPLGHQDHPEDQDKLVLLDHKDGQVLQAIRVHLDRRALVELWVMNHRTALLISVPNVDLNKLHLRSVIRLQSYAVTKLLLRLREYNTKRNFF